MSFTPPITAQPGPNDALVGWLSVSPFGGWQVHANRYGYAEQIATADTMEEAMRLATMRLNRSIVLNLTLPVV